MYRKYPTSTGTSYYEFWLLCGILRDDIDISDSNEDDVDTEHGSLIQHNLESWLKVDVKEMMASNVDLMYLHKVADQYVMKDIMGGITLWDEKFIRRA